VRLGKVLAVGPHLFPSGGITSAKLDREIYTRAVRTHMKATASIRRISTPQLAKYSSSLAMARKTAGFE
jgi:hypothetical protein